MTADGAAYDGQWSQGTRYSDAYTLHPLSILLHPKILGPTGTIRLEAQLIVVLLTRATHTTYVPAGFLHLDAAGSCKAQTTSTGQAICSCSLQECTRVQHIAHLHSA